MRWSIWSKGLPTMAPNHGNRLVDSPSEILRWPTERAKKWTCDFLKSAPANGSLLAVVAIGSAIRQNVVSTDLDLVVISAEVAPLHISPPMEIDLRVYSESNIEAKIAGGHDLLGWAVKFGKALFQRDHFWDRIVDGWGERLPLPSAALARERAVSAHGRLAEVLGSGDTDAVHEQAVSYLTHLARAELLDRRVYPACRPELPSQLRASTSSSQIAEHLERLLHTDQIDKARIDQLLKMTA